MLPSNAGPEHRTKEIRGARYSCSMMSVTEGNLVKNYLLAGRMYAHLLLTSSVAIEQVPVVDLHTLQDLVPHRHALFDESTWNPLLQIDCLLVVLARHVRDIDGDHDVGLLVLEAN